jgi:hypothetical protein
VMPTTEARACLESEAPSAEPTGDQLCRFSLAKFAISSWQARAHFRCQGAIF